MAVLMIGKSDSSCRTCAGKGADGSKLTHESIRAARYDPVAKQVHHYDIPGCGEKWDGIQSTYVYPNGYWEQWCKVPSGWSVSRYRHLIGLPCYDAFGKFVCNFGEGLDIQQELNYDS